jgi:hypothetical protein
VTLARVCGKCGTLLNKENTGALKWLQPDCNRCTYSNPTCQHSFKGKKGEMCLLCGFDKNYKEDLIK